MISGVPENGKLNAEIKSSPDSEEHGTPNDYFSASGTSPRESPFSTPQTRHSHSSSVWTPEPSLPSMEEEGWSPSIHELVLERNLPALGPEASERLLIVDPNTF
jgi:hypothetical protein